MKVMTLGGGGGGKSCTMEAIKVVNLVLLNHSTDGVSCDTTWYFTTTMKCLSVNTSHIPLSDTNHNVKIDTTNLWEALVYT